MQRRRGFQGLVVLPGILLALWAGQLRAQPATGPDPRAVIPADLYVDDDNAGTQDGSAIRPYRTVQQAINAAKDKAVIAVAGGIYPENIRIEEKAVRLYGGYAGGTKASYASGTAGNFKTRDPAANPSHLKGNGKDSVVSLQEAGASIVDGFLVTGGGPSALAAPLVLGGGFYIYGGSPTIANNVIEKNRTCLPVKTDETRLGGGIYATASTISILNNVIRDNVSGRGAGIAAEGPKLVIRGNTVEKNIGVSDHGGGISLFSPNAEISHNRIVGNEIGRDHGYGWGGGILVVNKGGKYKLSHNVFTANYAPSVGSAFFVDEGADASMDHDLVYANADNPAGEDAPVAPVYVDGADDEIGSTLTVNHVTIADHATKSAGRSYAISVTGKSKLTVKNSILWNNGGNDIFVDNISSATVTYTLGQKVLKGTGNLSKDPLFVNPTGRDYRLRSTSPAIDAADPASPFNLEPAPSGGRADLGAYGNRAPTSKAGKDDDVVKEKEPGKKTPKPEPEEKKTSKTYLLRGTAGELPSQVGDDNTKMTKVAAKELGGTAVQIELIDSFGQSKAKIEDWAPFDTLRLDIVNKGVKELKVEFNLFHSETKAFATRVVAPFVLKPGKNEVRIAVKDLKNTDGSGAKLAEVRRWFVSSVTPVTLLIGDIFLEGKEGKDNGGVTEKELGAKTSKTYLLRGTAGELPSQVGDDNTKMTKVAAKELGGTAIQIGLIDTFGQSKAKVEDWTPFDTLRLDIVNKGEEELNVEFNLFHSGTKAFATRVVAPFVLKPGKNEVRIAVKDLKNTNGSAAKLAEVRRWFVSSETPATLLVGDIFLEGKEGKAGSTAAYTIKTDPARLERIKSTKMPAFAKPIAYNTPEADAIMSAANILPADNPWNTLVDDWPVHPDSKKMVASIGADKPLRYNADMAFVIVPSGQQKVDVKIVEYPEESDPGPYPVADITPIEGWPASFQRDPKLKTLTLDDVQRGKPSLDEDRHGIVFDPVGRKLYEFYRLTKTDKGWHADQASIFDLASNKLRPDGWTSTDAAGLPILPAIVRYDEIKRGVIDHALRFTVVRSRRAYVYPATHFASKLTDESLPRLGERFRLRKDFDTSKSSAEARVILEALKRYGMLMADNGMDWGLSVSGDHRLPVFHDEFRRIKGSDFEVVTPPQGYVAP